MAKNKTSETDYDLENTNAFFDKEPISLSQDKEGMSTTGWVITAGVVGSALVWGGVKLYQHFNDNDHAKNLPAVVLSTDTPYHVENIKVNGTNVGDGDIVVGADRDVRVMSGENGNLDVADDQKTLEKMVGAPVRVLPNTDTGYILLNDNLSINEFGNLTGYKFNGTPYEIKVVVEKSSATSGAIAQVNIGGNISYVPLNASQTDKLLDYFDNLKLDNSQVKWSHDMIGKIGIDTTAYQTLFNMGKTLNLTGLEAKFGQDVSVIVPEVVMGASNAIANLDKQIAEFNATGLVAPYAERITELIGEKADLNETWQKYVTENLTAGKQLILDQFVYTVANITGQSDIYTQLGNLSPEDATPVLKQMLNTYINDTISGKVAAADGKARQEATEAVLDVWRQHLTGNYSAWLNTMGISAEDIADADANQLALYNQRINNAMQDDTTADSLVLKYGINGTALDAALDSLAGVGRFDSGNMNYKNAENAQKFNALQNYLANGTANGIGNLSLPWNTTELFENNPYSMRIVDTRESGALGVVYDNNGKLMTSKTKILSSDLVSAIKQFYGNNLGDE